MRWRESLRKADGLGFGIGEVLRALVFVIRVVGTCAQPEAGGIVQRGVMQLRIAPLAVVRVRHVAPCVCRRFPVGLEAARIAEAEAVVLRGLVGGGGAEGMGQAPSAVIFRQADVVRLSVCGVQGAEVHSLPVIIVAQVVHCVHVPPRREPRQRYAPVASGFVLLHVVAVHLALQAAFASLVTLQHEVDRRAAHVVLGRRAIHHLRPFHARGGRGLLREKSVARRSSTRACRSV